MSDELTDEYGALPRWLRERLERLDFGGTPARAFAFAAIAALGGRSIVETMDAPDGAEVVRRFLDVIEANGWA